MKIVAAKCPTCGANIEVDENSNRTKCDFCHSTIIVEDAIQRYKIDVSGSVKVENGEQLGYEIEKGRIKAKKEEEDRIRKEKEEEYKKRREEQRKIEENQQANKAVWGAIVFGVLVAISFLFIWGIAALFNYFEPQGYNGWFINQTVGLGDDDCGSIIEVRKNYVRIFNWENASLGYKIECKTNDNGEKRFSYQGHNFVITYDSNSTAEWGGIIVNIDGVDYIYDKQANNATHYLHFKRDDLHYTNAFK